jgi:hypothetical protein
MGKGRQLHRLDRAFLLRQAVLHHARRQKRRGNQTQARIHSEPFDTLIVKTGKALLKIFNAVLMICKLPCD